MLMKLTLWMAKGCQMKVVTYKKKSGVNSIYAHKTFIELTPGLKKMNVSFGQIFDTEHNATIFKTSTLYILKNLIISFPLKYNYCLLED